MIASLVITSFSGCEVFVDFGLKTSTFEMYDARLPNSDLNWNTLLLPGYQENNPHYRYIVKYHDNDRCTGEYYAADTLQYEVEGTWTLIERDVMRLQLDAFVDGDFKISKLDKITYLLETDVNKHGLPIDPPTLPLKLYNRKIY
jgi:hypothetical protein